MLARVADHTSQTLEREFLEFAPDAVIGVDEKGEIKLVELAHPGGLRLHA